MTPPLIFTIDAFFTLKASLFLCVNVELLWLTQKLWFCFICPKGIFPVILWLVNMHLSQFYCGFFCDYLKECGLPESSIMEAAFSQATIHGAMILLYLDLGDQPGSVLKFSIILSPPFKLFFCEIWEQYSSCSYVQGGWC